MEIETLTDVKNRLEASFGKSVGTFSGFKILENSMLPDNEILIVCGEKSYRAIIDNRKEEDNTPNSESM